MSLRGSNNPGLVQPCLTKAMACSSLAKLSLALWMSVALGDSPSRRMLRRAICVISRSISKNARCNSFCRALRSFEVSSPVNTESKIVKLDKLIIEKIAMAMSTSSKVKPRAAFWLCKRENIIALLATHKWLNYLRRVHRLQARALLSPLRACLYRWFSVPFVAKTTRGPLIQPHP